MIKNFKSPFKPKIIEDYRQKNIKIYTFNAGLKTVNTISTFPFYNGMIFPFSKMTIDFSFAL